MTTTEEKLRWVDRFKRYVGLAAEAGPYAKVLKPRDRLYDVTDAINAITWQTKCRIYNRQTECSHLKGGKYKPLGFIRDYALTTHTFIDGRTRIKCMLCGLEAWDFSGEDFKFAYMRRLADSSTNQPSASEQPRLEAKFSDGSTVSFPNTPRGRAEFRAKHPTWNGKVDGQDLFPEDSVYSISEDNERWVNFPNGHSPIKGRLKSTLENDEGITVVFVDELNIMKEKSR